ncbi:MAG: polysaccharide deacetylase family protein [Neisseriaceae bacterium]|nr:polysaccharide deacetylase family protein [Neisseriaceae bacterium]
MNLQQQLSSVFNHARPRWWQGASMVLSLMALSINPVATAKSVAFSFDDGVNPAVMADAAQVNATLLAKLAADQVTAIMYPALVKTGTAEGLDLVADWGKAGHRVGNHSDQHLNLNKPETTLTAYLNSMAVAEQRLNTLPGWTARYRFPFLKEGATVEKREGVRAWLRERHYGSGAVTIDASDWYYNQLYRHHLARADEAALAKLKRAYVAHIVARAHYYDALAQTVLGYGPKHVLLLHVNHINAAYIDAVILALKQDDWQIIDSDSAYQDPVYQREVATLPAGESLIWALAKAEGHKGLRYPAEDAPYEHANLKAHGLAPLP